jgi:predicted methyltransferase
LARNDVSSKRDRIVRDVAEAVGLAEGEAGVRRVAAAIARLEPVSIRRVSRAVELPVPIVASVCGELRKRALVAEERPAQLTVAGTAMFAGGILDVDGSGACRACAGRGIVMPREIGRALRDVARVAAAAPQARMELDQCHCTVETKLRRVLALYEADALVGRRILILGDDDLISLAIQSVVRRFGSGATIAGLTVLDVDPAVVRFVRSELSSAPFPVFCIERDLRDPLPRALVRRFDTVVTDPPYTVAAARLFLSRAAAALDGAGDVFFSFGSRRPGASFHVQQAIGEIGFTIHRLVRDFNEYVGAGVIGGSSHLYHLLATGELRASAGGTHEGPLYTADTGA